MRRLPIEYAARNLGRSRARLVLLVGASALVSILVLGAGAFVRGMEHALGSTGRDENVMVLGAGSEDSLERSEIGAGVAGILAGTVPGIRSRAGALYLSPEVHVQLPVGADAVSLVLVRGVTPAALLVHDHVQIVEGRAPRAGRDEVMVGSGVATKLGLDADPFQVGSTIDLEDRPWAIVGRFVAPGTVSEAEIWTSLTDLKAAVKRDTDSCVIATLDPGEGGGSFEDIDAFAKTRLDLELVAIRERDYYSRLASFFAPVRGVVWITAGLIGFGGLMGGLTTLHAGFAARVREFGTLRALGFRRVAIALSLVQESLIASCAGSLAACGAGTLALEGVAVRFSMGVFGLRVDAVSLGIALASAFALGVLGSIPPAWRCLRLSIPESLRSF